MRSQPRPTRAPLPLSEHYYVELCDVDFLSKNDYRVEIGGYSIDVLRRGLPAWDSLRRGQILASEKVDALKSAFVKLLRGEDGEDNTDVLPLAQILALECAYRGGDKSAFHTIFQKISSRSPARPRASKLDRAFDTREPLLLATSETLMAAIPTPMDRLRMQPVEYVASKSASDIAKGRWSLTDVAVETPVRKDFEALETNLDDPQSLLGFYRSTFSYVFELTAANHQVETLSNYRRALDVICAAGVKTVMDYGAGIGTFSLLCADRGLETTYADLASETFNYAERRMHGKHIRTAIIQDDGHIPQGFWDAIICTEVLEHVYDPDALTTALLSRINPGGLFVVSESFNYIDEFCTHLPMHHGKGGAVFIEHMQARGLFPVLVEPDCHVQVWRKPR